MCRLLVCLYVMAFDGSRHFINEFPDFAEGSVRKSDVDNFYNVQSKQIVTEWKDVLWKNVTSLLDLLEKKIPKDEDSRNDCSVYTGTSGYALLYMHLAVYGTSGPGDDYLLKGLSYVDASASNSKSKIKGTHGPSFLCGESGPLAIAAVINQKLNRSQESKQLLNRLESKINDVLATDSDELLYGRVGYLYALQFVRQYEIGDAQVHNSLVKQVIRRTLESGTELSKHDKWKCPLMYKWHDSYYLGAAHGVSGILFILLQSAEFLTKTDLEKYLKPTLDFLMTLRYPSGNYPSSIDSKSDRLVHWCHGAPGFIHLFIAAYQTFGDAVYLSEALGCGEVIWRRGILKKGYGLCHGTAGNAYGFLSLFKVTGDKKHLYRAIKFAEWIFDYGEHGCRIADRPLSLFEGLAGTIYFLVSMLDPWAANFPAFQLGS